MVFVIDLDDTICDTDKYSGKYIAKFIRTHKLPYHKVANNVRFAESKFDWTREEANEWYKQYGDTMMAKFPVKHGVRRLLNRLHRLGHTIVIATARDTDWHADPEGITMQWLKDKSIVYDQVFIGRVDKEKICEEVHADVFMDDDISNVGRVATYFESCNPPKYALLTTTLYNRTLPVPPGAVRIHKINQITKYVNKK